MVQVLRFFCEMPLIVICGYPCSGKTTTSIKLKEYLKNHIEMNFESLKSKGVTVDSNIVIVNDEVLASCRDTVYQSNIRSLC